MPDPSARHLEQRFTEIVRAQRAPQELLAYRMLGPMAHAEEIVQEVFLRLHERIEAIELDRQPIERWLTTLTMNLSRDALRHRKSRACVGAWLPAPLPSQEALLSGSAAEGGGEPGAEQRLLKREALGYGLLTLMERLSPTQRAVLLLRDLCEYSTRECATALRLSEANVKTSLHRARQLIAPMRHQWDEPDLKDIPNLDAILIELLGALLAGDLPRLEALLIEDIVLHCDGSGVYNAPLRPIYGREKVIRFFTSIARKNGELSESAILHHPHSSILYARLDHAAPRIAPLSLLLVQRDPRDPRRVGAIQFLAAPDKLTPWRERSSDDA